MEPRRAAVPDEPVEPDEVVEPESPLPPEDLLDALPDEAVEPLLDDPDVDEEPDDEPDAELDGVLDDPLEPRFLNAAAALFWPGGRCPSQAISPTTMAWA